MKKIILKKNPEKKTFFEILKHLFFTVFKERHFITNKNGKFSYYRISPFLQSFIFVFVVFGIYWTTLTTNMYFRDSVILKQKNIEVNEAKNKFNKAMADIKAYRDTLESVNKKIERSQNNIVNLLHKNESLTELEKDNLVKNSLLLSTELRYVNSTINDFANNTKWSNIESGRGSYTNTKNELEKNIVLNENVFLKDENKNLEKTLFDMKYLQDNLVDKITVLAEDSIKDIEKTLSKVDITLSQVNLKNRNRLVRKVEQEKGEGLGGKYIPLKNIVINDDELNEKFKEANLKVNLWEGLSKAKTMLPLGAPVRRLRITSHYGIRNDPFFKKPAMHNGIDFAGKVGTPLYVTAAGKVTRVGERGDYGLAVEIDHGLGFSTLFSHLSEISVKKGDVIDEGTKIGLAGSTGRSTGPHLHYEVRYNSRPLNPYAFVKAETKK